MRLQSDLVQSSDAGVSIIDQSHQLPFIVVNLLLDFVQQLLVAQRLGRGSLVLTPDGVRRPLHFLLHHLVAVLLIEMDIPRAAADPAPAVGVHDGAFVLVLVAGLATGEMARRLALVAIGGELARPADVRRFGHKELDFKLEILVGFHLLLVLRQYLLHLLELVHSGQLDLRPHLKSIDKSFQPLPLVEDFAGQRQRFCLHFTQIVEELVESLDGHVEVSPVEFVRLPILFVVHKEDGIVELVVKRKSSIGIHWRRNSGMFDGLQDGRKGIVSESHHQSDVFFNVLAEDGQDLVENVLLGGRQSGQRRLDDETDGLQLLDSVATLKVTLKLLHDLVVLFNSAGVAESRSVDDSQRIAQSTSFHLVEVVSCHQVRLAVGLRLVGRLVDQFEAEVVLPLDAQHVID